MRFVIDQQELFLSEDAIRAICDIVSAFIRKNPFHVEDLENYDLLKDRSIVPFFNRMTNYIAELYITSSLPRRVMIATVARSILASLETHIGLAARPPKKCDPVAHALDIFSNALIDQLQHIEGEVVPNATIQISTQNGIITSLDFRTDQDKTGGTVALNGYERIGKDDGGKADRQATQPPIP